MPALHADERFARALLAPDGAPPPGLTAAGGDAVARRFAIHRNTVGVTLSEALAVAFPVVRQLVGDDFFAAAARAFVTAAPPTSPVLADYGAGFADFLARFPPAAELPYLPDVARLERLMVESYHSTDAPAETRAGLAGLSPQEAAPLTLARHPAARWLCSPWPVVTLWRMNAGHLPLTPLSHWAGESALVTRPELDVMLTALPVGGDQLLSVLETPLSLAALSEAMEPVGGLAGALPPLLDAGAVRRASTPQGEQR
ncbi:MULTISPECIES: DNA-binding domain-containing protein [unclassified Xanthobacter]|uniref:HvfC/BufC N-terminal domain-containing protein n=1 Tax=unclassified Xanthobacter TaxID=2623496 RepID=UPI001F36743B|nr:MULTISPECIES: DNA-binding domain-containing protein [unclassified Xanthobacter]